MALLKINQFFKTESSKDALRNILSITIPGIVLFLFTGLDFAISFSVGILMAAMSDIPGNRADKFKTVQWAVPIFAVTAFSVSYLLSIHSWVLVLALGIFGFVYTFISIFGFRISVIGNLGLVVASFTIGLHPTNAFMFSLAMILGVLTYYLISLIQVHLFPYRSLQYAVEEAIDNMARLMRLKINCYDENSSLSQSYKDLSVLHIRVSDQLENVRSLLLREKQLLKSDHEVIQKWLIQLYHLVDLYELLMANDLDYETIRGTLKDTQGLPLIRIALSILAEETQKIEFSKPENTFKPQKREELQTILNSLSELELKVNLHQKNLLISLRSHIEQVRDILFVIKTEEILEANSWIDTQKYIDFVAPKNTFGTLLKNLSFKSTLFTYSIRMAVLITVAGLIGFLLPEFKYASWIILTIVLVARPTFFTTQKRNYQRIVGSFIGLIISLGLIFSLSNAYILFGIAIVSLYFFLLFNKPNYLVCVIFVTIAIVLGQNLYNGDTTNILSSRFVFTLIGAFLAALGTLAIPINHYRTVEKTTNSLVLNFKNYLEKITDNLQTNDINFYDLRLFRKFTQTALAQSYDSLEQLLKEPVVGKKFKEEINLLQSLAYRTNAMLLGLSVNITKPNGQNGVFSLNERISSIHLLIKQAEDISKKIAKSNSTKNARL